MNIFSILLKRPSPPKPTLTDLFNLQQLTLMKVSEVIQLVKDVNQQLIKAKGEILGKIARLESADGELTPEQSAAVQDLRATVQGLDDIIPDDPEAPGKPIVTEDAPPAAPAEEEEAPAEDAPPSDESK